MEYPYYSMIYKLNKKRVLSLVSEFRPIYMNKQRLPSLSPDVYAVLVDKWDTHYELNQLTDLFTEKIRVKCKFLKNPSPIEYFSAHRTEMLRGNPTPFQLRERIYREIRLCNNFKISVALAVLQHFRPRTWLDISAGWGDRLLAAIFYGVDLYFSCDPNKDLHPCYEKMIKIFVPQKKRAHFVLRDTGFEKTKLPNVDFDIVFSSPPFFDLETYSSHENNSLVQFPTSNEWYRKFLLKSLKKAIAHLKKGGHLVLYIGYFNQIEEMHDFLQKKMKYLGNFYFMDTKARGMYVYQRPLE